ncbi:MAG: chorismate mutase [Rhodospirillales bacterium]|nr:chorismate mutase [Rhodospirillales bacterium]MCW8861187.1 chorismate mutase [Rhodospirillales bacterium]MCW8951877.1 chorismate mutase [Rhodospirillales bacterium]MCW8971153.1 chorismate mutase [Rhodospirillales bacterium]MCW9002658.1 chorismate mutase [Rhodospirillales bacterium]
MADEKTELNKLREEIDEIDNSIHDLIMRRTQIVEKVRDVKSDSAVKIRPSREAEILYRLVNRHEGPFPKRELVRIWRELIVATLSFEGPFSTAVYAPQKGSGYWDLARDQYGSFTKMVPNSSVRRVVDSVRSKEYTVGILPIPNEDDAEPWWPILMREHEDTPRIIARLPFAGPGNGRGSSLEALVICPLAAESTGRDRSYIGIDAEEPLSRPRLLRELPEIGMTPRFLATYHDKQRPEVWMHLIETDGFIAAGDPRLESLLERFGDHIKRVVPLGSYAIPLTQEEMD